MNWGKRNDSESRISNFENLPEVSTDEEGQSFHHSSATQASHRAQATAASANATNANAHGAQASQARPLSTIGRSVNIQGTLSGDEDVTMLGTIKGEVILKNNNLVVGRTGRVEANVIAQCIAVEGEVVGDLYANHVTLRKNGKVLGNIVSPRIAIDDGAEFKGSIDMDSQAIKEKLGKYSQANTQKSDTARQRDMEPMDA